MKIKVPSFIKWRYDVYCSEYVDLYGSLSFYLKHKKNNLAHIKQSDIAYIYANKRNVGDYISFCGIRHLIGVPGIELFCSSAWKKEFKKHIDQIKTANPQCLLIIGGGGLLQPVFNEFWSEVLDSKLPYVMFGIGINRMQGRPEMESSYTKKLVENASFIGVRDNYTQNALAKITNVPIHMGICPSVNFVNKHFWQNQSNRSKILLHIYHPSDLRLAGADLDKISNSLKTVARRLGYTYQEDSNMSANHMKTLEGVSNAGIVVSSRLHGCIMSFSMGLPFIPLLCDEKISSFNQSYTGVEGYAPTLFYDPDMAFNAVSECFLNFDKQKTVLDEEMLRNHSLAEQIKALISYSQS